jgi:enterochelin esterase-like enzyme
LFLKIQIIPIMKQMIRLSAFIIFLWIIACQGAFCQSDSDFHPAGSNVLNAEFPKISADNSVYFRLKAPEAIKVQVQGGDGLCPKPLTLVKDTAGNWNGIIPKAGPGFHYYWFVVDGVRMNDPGSDSYFGYGFPTGGIEIPNQGEDFFSAKNVAHGDVREHWYYSDITGKWRRSFIYTPPDYDRNKGKKYPVLYLLHGAGENERGWSNQGHMNFILDNLIAEKKAVPMIVVMDNGYATAKDAPAATQGFSMKDLPKMAETLEQVYIKEIIPDIDSHFRTLPDRENRALAGLSMGGLQTMLIGMNHIELFSHFGFFSGAIFGNILDDPRTAFKGVFADAATFNKKVKTFWFGAGSGEDMFVKMMDDSRKKFSDIGIKSIGFISQGTYHEWLTWRRDLKEFAPLLFKK